MRLNPIAMRLVPVAALVAAAVLPARADFSGAYAVSNFSLLTSISSDGFVDTTGAPASITLFSSDSGEEASSTTDFQITVPESGTITFDWDYSTFDGGAIFDPFAVVVNGTETTVFDDSSLTVGSGLAYSVPVLAGDTFAFRLSSTDNIFGRGSVTISNFSGPVSSVAPEPGTIALLGVGLLGGLAVARRRR
jgi:hypothetical protein